MVFKLTALFLVIINLTVGDISVQFAKLTVRYIFFTTDIIVHPSKLFSKPWMQPVQPNVQDKPCGHPLCGRFCRKILVLKLTRFKLNKLNLRSVKTVWLLCAPYVRWMGLKQYSAGPTFSMQSLFSDETHFWLNSYANKQNCRICSEENPKAFVKTLLHLLKVTV